MCGIVGSLGVFDFSLIRKMNDKIKHRGPDGEGYYINQASAVALGHRRLAIIDLSERGIQPMKYNGLNIVYNGEVYNFMSIKEQLLKAGYTFDSDTDTEVILKAYDYWREDCLQYFNGMFAFAIWDEERSSLFCARDRLGIKPFYYHYDPLSGKLIFASEIKAILEYNKVKWQPNDKIIFDYLYYGFIDHTEHTFFEGIQRLMPGHYFIFDEEHKINIQKFWDVEDQIQDEHLKEDCITKFKEIIDDSVRLNLISDVKVGTSLSGGLDSTTIAALVQKYLEIDALQETISYTSQYKEFDESLYIKDFITNKRIKNSMITKTSGDFWNDLRRLVYYQEEPFISTGMYAGYSVMESANKLGTKVMLNGQGADEILGGYRKYRVYYIREMVRKKRYINALKGMFFTLFQLGASYNFKDDFKKFRNIFSRKKQSTLEAYIKDEFIKKFYNSGIHSKSFTEALVNDIKYISLPSLLRYEDKNSMAWSIEARVPFLDHNLVEFCMNIPIEYKMNGGWSKWILRKSMENVLPKSIIGRKDKMGFATEQSIWLYKNREFIKRLFLDEDMKSSRYISKEKLLMDFENIIEPGNQINIWRIINLELWMREFFRST